MKSFIAFDRNKIYTSLQKPDLNPGDSKLILLLELTHEIGKFGYVISQEALEYLSESDIQNYFRDIVPILYNIHYHKDYNGKSDLGDPDEYIKDWKSRRREPWIDNFYLSGDFRFISESAKGLNLPITYLDRLSDQDLYQIYKEMIESEINPNDIIGLKYLSKIYRSNSELKANNIFGNLVLGLYDSRRPEKWSDYKLLNPSRTERRLILEKLEKINLHKESAKDLRELLKILHPADYKKLFPGVWKYWSELGKTQDSQEASDLLDSGEIDEFTSRFIGYLYSGKSDEADLCTLLYSTKLKATDLLKIFGNLSRYEVGVPRYWGNENYWCNSSSVVSIIPTIKEFILSRVGSILKDDELQGKNLYLDPELKEYNFPEQTKRKLEPKVIGKLTEIDKVEFSVLYDSDTCYLSYLTIYLWKGRGKVFKKVRFPKWIEYKGTGTELTLNTLDLKNIKDRGFKYIIFDNKIRRHHGKRDVEVKIGNLTIHSESTTRNSLGGIIDLQTLEVTVLNSDISGIPTYNGNIPEAIVRYILPEFRFTAYDFMSIIATSSGATIVKNQEPGCIKIYPQHYLKKLKDI